MLDSPKSLDVSGRTVKVRAAQSSDVDLLLDFIHEMAEFEKLQVHTTRRTLHESLFGEHPAAHSILAFKDEQPAAYAVYCFSFATMIGRRCLWLDDLFVRPAYRGKGIGKALLALLAQLAIENDCGRFEWMVLDWNKQATRFYQEMGATLLDNWRICRVDSHGLEAIARHVKMAGGSPPS